MTTAVALTAVMAVGLIADSQKPIALSVSQWVAMYEHDPIDASVRLKALPDRDAYELRDSVMGAAKRWPKGAPSLGDPLLALAAFAVELEYARIDANDWREIPGHDSGKFAVTRAATLIERRAQTDAAAHAWWRVALTLGEVNRDGFAMFAPLQSHPPVRFDFIRRALAMFPNDSGFQFSEARLHASYVATLPELESPQTGVVQMQPGVFASGYGYQGAPSHRQLDQLDEARSLLAALTADPLVGPAARFWSGYVQLVTGDVTGARDTISAIARAGENASNEDPDLRYTAWVLLGYIDEALGRIDDGTTDYRSALRVRPKSQTASLALAALLSRAGESDEAERLVKESLHPRGSGDDPWRLLSYGDLALLPQQIAALRLAVSGRAK